MDVAERLIKKGFKQKQGAAPATLQKHRVTFFPKVSVILIPSTKEYHEANLACDLWFEDHEYASYKSETRAEIKTFIEKQAAAGIMMTIRDALHVLYQPEDAQTSEHSLQQPTPAF